MKKNVLALCIAASVTMLIGCLKHNSETAFEKQSSNTGIVVGILLVIFVVMLVN